MGRHTVSSRRCPRRAPLGSLGALGSPFRSTLSGWSNPAGYGRCCRLPFTPWPPRRACAECGLATAPAEPWRREGDCRHALSPWRCPRGINRKICIFAPVPAGAARRKENPGMANTNLAAARTAKNDEFYTQYHDIEAEMNAYLDYDPDTFRDKTVLLPCDDPEWSSFTRSTSRRGSGTSGSSGSSARATRRGASGTGAMATDHLRDAQPALPPGAVAVAGEDLHPRPRRQRRRADRHR